MATLSEHHKKLNAQGVGKCSVPMWSNGCPAGFCDADAYGPQEKGQQRYGEYIRGVWHPGYCSGLACYSHGGPRVNNISQWRIEYDNDTGPNDEGYHQWWIVTNDIQTFTCTDKTDAKWLCARLNKN